MAEQPTKYGDPGARVQTDWLASHLDDPLHFGSRGTTSLADLLQMTLGTSPLNSDKSLRRSPANSCLMRYPVSDSFENPHPVFQCGLMSRHELNDELIIATFAERADPIAQFGRSRGKRSCRDKFRGEEFLLLRPYAE